MRTAATALPFSIACGNFSALMPGLTNLLSLLLYKLGSKIQNTLTSDITHMMQSCTQVYFQLFLVGIWLLSDELISIIIGNMQTQQQLDQSQLDNLDEFAQDQYQETTLINSKPLQTKYTVFVITLIILLVASVVLLTLYIAYSLQETPKVHIQYLQQAYLPSNRQTQRPRVVQSSRSPLLQVVSTQIKRMTNSAQFLVDVQSTNSAHRSYQHITRKLQSQNCHMALDKYASKRMSDNSALTYSQYLRAVDFLQLTTFPIGDIYNNEYIQLSNKDRDHFQKQYDINPFITETSICAVMSLTNEGLQSGTYYYALKSLLHQQYNNLRVVVINSPEMHMLNDISKLLSLYPYVNVTFIDKMTAKEKIGTSFFVRAAIHKYCKQSDLTLLLRDSGELIGLQVFKVIDKVYQTEKYPIIFTHYLLESSHPLRQVEEQFRYHVQLYHSFKNPRESAYKTKHLKFYKTDLLLKLEEEVFQLANEWTDGLYQANLQFAFLELTCGKYYLLQQILYKASKNDMENALQVLDARLHQKQPCLTQVSSFNTNKKNDKQHPIVIPAKDVRFLDIREIQNLNNNDLSHLKAKFRQMLNSRARLYSKIYIRDKKTVNLTAIDQSSLTSAKGINLQQVIEVAQLMHVGVRPQLYMQELQQKLSNKQSSSKPDDKSKLQGKKMINNDPPPQSQAKPSPFSTQQTQFCIFLFTRNNYDSLSFLYTIQSIITQVYSKFKLIILDNKSTDRTAEIIKYHLSIIPEAEKRLVTFKQASRGLRRSELLNHAISTYASPRDVVVVMESGDQLIGNFVFKYLNEKYKVTQAPAVYSNSVYLQNDIIHVGPSQIVPLNIISQKSFRNHPLYYNQLRTFKSSLFSKISQQDFKDDRGEWINFGQDQILSYAIEELSCGNIAYLNKILVRLHKKPQMRVSNSSLGSKYECLQSSQLKVTP